MPRGGLGEWGGWEMQGGVVVGGRCTGLGGDGETECRGEKKEKQEERKEEGKKEKRKKKVENNLNINRAVSFPPVKIFFLPNERK